MRVRLGEWFLVTGEGKSCAGGRPPGGLAVVLFAGSLAMLGCGEDATEDAALGGEGASGAVASVPAMASSGTPSDGSGAPPTGSTGQTPTDSSPVPGAVPDMDAGAPPSDGPSMGASDGGDSGQPPDGGQPQETDGGQDSGGSDVCQPADTSAKPDTVTLEPFSEILFYDGYAETKATPTPAGTIRHSNSLYGAPLETRDLSPDRNLAMEVRIKAACDNYDRIGRVYVAMVPKGATTYDPNGVTRLEVARFITPFMDKNLQPDTVGYQFGLDNLMPILTDAALAADVDFWIELEVFGVPYAANNEIDGCGGRDDVFYGSVTLRSDGPAAEPAFNRVRPLSTAANFNNYQDGASDALGTTRKTLAFSLDESWSDARLTLIISQHGADQGGEEYSRRDHFVYVNGDQKLMFKPGRTTCEPFRMYNTQPNGIYGLFTKSDSAWQAFSNWCPGDRIDTRVIELGDLAAGEHEVVVDVPTAVFNDGKGNFPLSIYLQGIGEAPACP